MYANYVLNTCAKKEFKVFFDGTAGATYVPTIKLLNYLCKRWDLKLFFSKYNVMLAVKTSSLLSWV